MGELAHNAIHDRRVALAIAVLPSRTSELAKRRRSRPCLLNQDGEMVNKDAGDPIHDLRGAHADGVSPLDNL